MIQKPDMTGEDGIFLTAGIPILFFSFQNMSGPTARGDSLREALPTRRVR